MHLWGEMESIILPQCLHLNLNTLIYDWQSHEGAVVGGLEKHISIGVPDSKDTIFIRTDINRFVVLVKSNVCFCAVDIYGQVITCQVIRN